jgi:hypothetical protein
MPLNPDNLPESTGFALGQWRFGNKGDEAKRFVCPGDVLPAYQIYGRTWPVPRTRYL